jgi:hypothetical protein
VLLPALAALLWGVQQARLGAQRHDLVTTLARDPDRILELRHRFHMPQGHLAVASYATRDVFPPDRALALEAIGRALAAEPLSARAWQALARERLLEGQDDAARQALALADRLEPRFPRQRLEAVRLWRLAGDSRRSLETALEVAALGPQYRREAALELLLAGSSPAEVFTVLGGPRLAPGAAVELAAALHNSRLDQMSDLVALIPAAAADDQEARHQLAALLLRPLQSERLMELWRLEDPPPQTAFDGITLANRDLLAPPFFNRFPLGWIPPQERGAVRVIWLSPLKPADTGRIRTVLPELGPPFHRGLLYRLLLPAGPARQLPLRVRATPAGQVQVEVTLREADRTTARVRLDPTCGEWQALPLPLPARDAPAIAVVAIEVRRLGKENTWREALVEFGPIGHPATGSPSPFTIPPGSTSTE